MRVTQSVYARLVLSIIGFLWANVTVCYSESLVLVTRKHSHLAEQQQIESVAGFFGLTLRHVRLTSDDATRCRLMPENSSHVRAILIAEDSLDALNRADIPKRWATARRQRDRPVPVLVFGINSKSDAKELKLWSGGAVQGCVAAREGIRPQQIAVGDDKELSSTLAGYELPAVASPTCAMQIKSASRAQTVLSARGNDENDAVLVRTFDRAAEVFFTPQMKTVDASWIGKPRNLASAFSSMASFLVFLSYASRDYKWHLDGHYANLTIDDPWLIQPYGHLDYPALLAEMERHRFHTTIAFVPWNFDRSKPEVVSLLRAHRNRFSISIHGDNHIHREFGEYRKDPLHTQIANIKQAVARMERFHTLTGLSYDRFMVFPHAIAPEATLAALRRYGFLGTANSQNVPLGRPYPTDPIFLLRPFTSAYGNLLSVFRYPANEQVSSLEIAIQCFLGNPLLFYGHEDLFDTGIDAFDRVADAVNRTQPDTRWMGLGEIARHLHLIRQCDDGGFEVRMFSSQMDLKNSLNRSARFRIEREGDSGAAISAVTVDDTPVAFRRCKNSISLTLMIPAQKERRIRFLDANLHPDDNKIKSSGLHVWAIRHISDFRDLYLSRFPWGSWATHFYYDHGWNLLEVKLESTYSPGAVIVILLPLAGILYARRRKRHLK
jgi:hypothetical protein